MHSTSLESLCDILGGTKTRLLVAGGAGSLYVNAASKSLAAAERRRTI